MFYKEVTIDNNYKFKANFIIANRLQKLLDNLLVTCTMMEKKYKITRHEGPFKELLWVEIEFNLSDGTNSYSYSKDKYELKFQMKSKGRLKRIDLYSKEHSKHYESISGIKKVKKMLEMI